MRLPILLAKAATGAAVAALAVTGAAVIGVATAPAASACGGTLAANRPISPDAPYDTPATNAYPSRMPPIWPAAGTDFGHLPRWKHFTDGRVLLREDRVTLRGTPNDLYVAYTNVNPRIRSYWLDRDAAILVHYDNYVRMTGQRAEGYGSLYRVGRQQFLDSFNTGGNEWYRQLKYRSVYRLTFDRTHAHVRKIEELRQFFGC